MVSTQQASSVAYSHKEDKVETELDLVRERAAALLEALEEAKVSPTWRSDLECKVKELESRIRILENRPTYIPYYPQLPYVAPYVTPYPVYPNWGTTYNANGTNTINCTGHIT